MAKVRKTAQTRQPSALTTLRRQAKSMVAKIHRMGTKELQLIERRLAQLNRDRVALLAEIGIGAGATSKSQRNARTKTTGRTDWDAVFAKLPKTSFRAGDVKSIVPHVAGGTLSIRLTQWVKEKKLRRTGTRRGTRYTRL